MFGLVDDSELYLAIVTIFLIMLGDFFLVVLVNLFRYGIVLGRDGPFSVVLWSYFVRLVLEHGSSFKLRSGYC